MKKPKIILDYGVNHEGDIKKALEAIEIIASNGNIDAVKFQHYNPLELGKAKNYQLSKTDYQTIAKRCEEKKLKWGISLFGSTWEDIAYFENLGVNFFKIAARENCSDVRNLLKNVTCDVIASSNNFLMMDEYDKINYYMICISEYPCFSFYDLLKRLAQTSAGYSCHTPYYHVCLAAQMLGVPIIEKHFTLDHKQSSFRDHKHALDPRELNEWTYWINYYNHE